MTQTNTPAPLYPLTFTPVFKDYIWGGRNLTKYHRRLPADTDIAESWEIAGHKDGTTAVANGALQGMLLTELQQQYGLDLIGTNGTWAHERGKFPLLIKLLDANKPLSVQVHPKDDYALEHEGNELGKTEMWVVLDVGEDAGIILGIKSGANRDNFRQAIADGNLEQFLHRLPVKKGDVVCVPAGSLHAILEGVVIAEIQQNSNTTYRVYDWNRMGVDGKPRQLHVDKALDVINFDQVEPKLSVPPLKWKTETICAYSLCENEYFVTERIEMPPGGLFQGKTDGTTMEIWGLIYGDGTAKAGGTAVQMYEVTWVLMPASIGKFTIRAKSNAIFLRTYLPEGSD